MALPFHLVFLLCLTSGLLISGTWSWVLRRPAGWAFGQACFGNGCLINTVCPSGWTPLGNRCFVAETNSQTKADAELNCIARGGNLASIHSLAENNLISKLLLQTFHRGIVVWIGLFDAIEEGKWMWTDGSTVDYLGWRSGEPNNFGGGEHCVAMKPNDALGWNDVPCGRRYPYVCARDQLTPRPPAFVAKALATVID